MTKKQKIWLAVFGAMFLVPEILWGGVRSLITKVFFQSSYSSIFSLSVFSDINSNFIASLISMIQFIGILIFVLVFIKLKINLFIKLILITILFFLIFFSFIFAWMGVYYLKNSPNF
jgi:hypothetical protein